MALASGHKYLIERILPEKQFGCHSERTNFIFHFCHFFRRKLSCFFLGAGVVVQTASPDPVLSIQRCPNWAISL